MPPDTPDLPEAVLEAGKQKRLVLFIGAGLSCSAGLPGWETLKTQLIAEFTVSPGLRSEEVKEGLRAETNFYKCFEEIHRQDPTTYSRVMNKSLIPSNDVTARFNSLVGNLWKLDPISVVTLNIDPLLADNHPFGYLGVRRIGECWPWELGEKRIFFFHGVVDSEGGNGQGWVFSNSELTKRYDESADSKKFLPALFSGFYRILFIGFSFSDDLLLKFAELPEKTRLELDRNQRPPFHHALVAENEYRAINRMRALGVEPLIYKLVDSTDSAIRYGNFARTLSAWGGGATQEKSTVVSDGAQIPSEGPALNV